MTRRIVVSGVVDGEAVGTVERAVRGALEGGSAVELDIRGVDRWVDDALRSLADCARLGSGVEIRAEGRRGAGRHAPVG